ncbi:MAG: septal ring lytic transglycosylase RlpA family protein [Sandaracinus sp.]
MRISSVTTRPRAPRVLAVVTLSCALAACGNRAAFDPNLRSSATITRSRRARALEPSSPPPTDAGPPDTEPAPTEEPASGEWWSSYASREALETFEGRASYYADRFEGRPTASGEPYRASERTAASRDLPFGTVLRVTRVDTGESVIVRVNDRGPFGDRARVLDLSRSAAEALDMIRRGVIDARVEVLERPE